VDDLADIGDEGNLVTLKGTLDDIVKAQGVLTEALAQAQLWQKGFELHHAQHLLLIVEQEKLKAAFGDLREANDQNPHLKAVDDLDDIAGEADLAVIKGNLDDIVIAQGLLKEALVLAKTWKPEEVVDDL